MRFWYKSYLEELDAPNMIPVRHDQALPVPPLVLAARLPPHNAIVKLDVSPLPPDYQNWSKFHNGCSAGGLL